MASFSYETDGTILILRVAGTVTDHERKPVYDAVRDDPDVPNHALLLLDIREVNVAMYSGASRDERLRVLLNRLGSKLGPVCAMIVPPELMVQETLFQAAGRKIGLGIALFSDEPAARDWLMSTRPR